MSMTKSFTTQILLLDPLSCPSFLFTFQNYEPRRANAVNKLNKQTNWKFDKFERLRQTSNCQILWHQNIWPKIWVCISRFIRPQRLTMVPCCLPISVMRVVLLRSSWRNKVHLQIKHEAHYTLPSFSWNKYLVSQSGVVMPSKISIKQNRIVIWVKFKRPSSMETCLVLGRDSFCALLWSVGRSGPISFYQQGIRLKFSSLLSHVIARGNYTSPWSEVLLCYEICSTDFLSKEY